MRQEQQNSPDTVCSRCGADATWSFVDEAQQIVEIVCPDCGRFEVTRDEFENAEFNLPQSEDRRS